MEEVEVVEKDTRWQYPDLPHGLPGNPTAGFPFPLRLLQGAGDQYVPRLCPHLQPANRRVPPILHLWSAPVRRGRPGLAGMDDHCSRRPGRPDHHLWRRQADPRMCCTWRTCWMPMMPPLTASMSQGARCTTWEAGPAKHAVCLDGIRPLLERHPGQTDRGWHGEIGDREISGCSWQTSARQRRDLGWSTKINVEQGVNSLDPWVSENKELF